MPDLGSRTTWVTGRPSAWARRSARPIGVCANEGEVFQMTVPASPAPEAPISGGSSRPAARFR